MDDPRVPCTLAQGLRKTHASILEEEEVPLSYRKLACSLAHYTVLKEEEGDGSHREHGPYAGKQLDLGLRDKAYADRKGHAAVA